MARRMAASLSDTDSSTENPNTDSSTETTNSQEAEMTTLDATTESDQPDQAEDAAVVTAEIGAETDSADNTENTEQTDSADNTENTEQTDSADASTEAAPKASAEPVNLTAFEAATSAAIEQRDLTAGAVPEAYLSAVTTEYRNLEGSRAKSAAKRHVESNLKAAIKAMDIPLARAWMTVQENLTSGGGGSTTATREKAPVDPTESAAAQRATLILALDNLPTPEGVDSETLDAKVSEILSTAREQVLTYITYLTTEPPAPTVTTVTNEDGTTSETEVEPEPLPEPEVSVVAKNAAKLALGRSARTSTRTSTSASSGGGGGSRAPFTGVRKDVARHIQQAFADQPVGTFLKIGEIAEFESEEYTTDGVFRKPSPGAISARLFPSSGKAVQIDGIEPATVDGKKGARRVA